MDNLTHSIIGLIAGESVHAAAPPARGAAHALGASARRRLYAFIGVVGGNLPDLDLLVSGGGPQRDKLAYLLHHRGHTHTLVGCALLALLLYLGVALLLRWRKIPVMPRERWLLAAFCAGAVLLHLGMDALNNYGVHPFWPLDDGWHYGDSLFIVEPSYWVAGIPLWFALHGRLARGFIAVAVLAAFVLSLVSGMVLAPSLVALAVMGALLAAVSSRLAPARAVMLSALACMGLTALFVVAGRVAAADARALARTWTPARLLDHVLTPAPANPLCWDVLLLQAEGQRYTLRHARLSLAPAWLPARRCPAMSDDERATLPRFAVASPDTDALHWRGEYSMSRQDLAGLARRHCEAAAFLQFSRAPFILRKQAGWVIGDARYDREPGLGFAELALPPAGSVTRACPPSVPWLPPREDLLSH